MLVVCLTSTLVQVIALLGIDVKLLTLSPTPPLVQPQGGVKESTHWTKRERNVVSGVVVWTHANLSVSLRLSDELTTFPQEPLYRSRKPLYDDNDVHAL